MSKTLLWFIVLAGVVVIVFVIGRFASMDTGLQIDANKMDKSVAHLKSEFDAWMTFQPDDTKFTASFPRKPIHLNDSSRQNLGGHTRKYDIYAADGLDKKAYMIEVITFPKGPNPEKNENILENTLRDILANSTLNVLESSQKENFKGKNALSFKINSGQKKLQGLLFVWNQTLYILTRVEQEGENADKNEDYQFFIDSFKLNAQKTEGSHEGAIGINNH